MFILSCLDGKGYSRAINVHRVKIRLEDYGKEKNGSYTCVQDLRTLTVWLIVLALMQQLARENKGAAVVTCKITTLI
jgi:hypothetical protein